MSNKKEQPLGGCPPLEQQAVNRNTEAKLRYDLEMGKMTLEAIKKFKTMFKDWDNLKDNIKWSMLMKIFDANKEFMKEHKELLLSNSDTVEEEDDTPMISLSSSETSSKTLN
tara:strand:- start:161 stop:496 length:336 start_codon:yes stop_codon:yes gene_type:complete